MKQQPLVSILLPICNNRHFLSGCLKSLLSQSYKNLEIIAYDDYSKDNSYQLLKAYKKKDKRLRVYKNKKRYGMAICLNRALARAKGTFIAFMDPNDIATRDRIRRQILFLLSHLDVAAVGTQAVIIDSLGKKLTKTSFPKNHQTIVQSLLSGTSLQFETTMINKMLLPKDLLHFQKTGYPILFTDLFTKILPYGEITNLPWALYQKRQVENNSIKILRLIPPVLRLWFGSFVSDYRLPLSSLFTPLVKQA